jgi:ribosomal protein S18 acetylase RimI-like enzyme
VAEAGGVAIRPGVEGDEAAAAAIVERAYGGYVEEIGARPAPMDADYREAARAGTLFVAEDGPGIAGLIVLVEEPDHLEIENVAVAPERQGRGTGRTLLAFAESEARRRGLAEIRLFTHVVMVRNQRIYTRLGYTETERRADNGFERIFYSKRLTA